jgi:cell division protein FtsQ
MTSLRSAPPDTTRADESADDLLAGTEYGALFADEPAVVVHPRFAQRRAVVERIEFKARSRRQLAMLAATVVALFVVVAWQSGLVTVRRVDVVGATHTDADVVRRIAALNGAPSLFWLDTAGAAQRVESLPWVASASSERHRPGRVTVRVVEQGVAAFVAAADGAGTSAIIGPDDRVLATTTVAPTGVPRIVGVRVPRVGERVAATGLGRLAASLPTSMRSQLREIRAADPRSIAIELDGTEVRIGSTDDIATKLAAAEAVLAAEADQHCAGHYVDVSTPTTAVAGC